MSKHVMMLSCLLVVGLASPTFAARSFYTVGSEIHSAYAGNVATLSAVRLRANGSTNPTSLTPQGIGNQTGTLR
ncbi:MAG TPA: hypothetical protein VK726_03635 [Acetobacteraceae bacterium]|jgi:hypothetical protein|nr:hypothetical protein [Acetobacteraceae bacterium]